MQRKLVKFICFTLFTACSCSHPTYKTTGPAVSMQGETPYYDWMGSYEGNLLNAHCDSIATILTLKKNRSYNLSITPTGNTGKAQHYKGKFAWDRYNDRDITILTGKDSLNLQIEPNRIRQVTDKSCSALNALILSKTNKTINGKSWKILEIMGITPDSTFATPYISFFKGKFLGALNCRSFRGKYRFDARNNIFIDSLNMIELPCWTGKENAQEGFVKAMRAASHVEFDGDYFIISNARKERLMKLELQY